MIPDDLDWQKFEDDLVSICEKCLDWIQRNRGKEPIFGFGFEGGIEQGLVYVSAGSTPDETGERNWYPPEWSLTYIDERLEEDITVQLLGEFTEPIDQMVYGDSPDGTWETLCRRFRLASLKALRRVSDQLERFEFSRTADFSLVYMDEGDAHYRGLDQIVDGIDTLKTDGDNKAE